MRCPAHVQTSESRAGDLRKVLDPSVLDRVDDIFRQDARDPDGVHAGHVVGQPLPLGDPARLGIRERDDAVEHLRGAILDGVAVAREAQELLAIGAAGGLEALGTRSAIYNHGAGRSTTWGVGAYGAQLDDRTNHAGAQVTRLHRPAVPGHFFRRGKGMTTAGGLSAIDGGWSGVERGAGQRRWRDGRLGGRVGFDF
jgi:hypothetical protein